MEVKFCKGCETVKDLEQCFYRAGKSWQSHCKKCHNARRLHFRITPSKYVKRPKGFAKLDKELQEKIIYDIHIKISYRDIAKKYGIYYNTILNWKKNNSIPKYIEPSPQKEVSPI